MLTYFVDIDGILCTNTNGDYEHAQPRWRQIGQVRKLKHEGHRIVLWTARGATTGRNWKLLTEEQMDEWGVPYDELRLDKPHYDRIIDDKAENWA